MKKFIIISPPKSGSTLLSQYILDKDPSLQYLSSVFTNNDEILKHFVFPNRYSQNTGYFTKFVDYIFQDKNIRNEFKQYRNNNWIEYLNTIITPMKNGGFKWHPYFDGKPNGFLSVMDSLINVDDLKNLLIKNNFKFITLQRKNKVDQIISIYISIINNYWINLPNSSLKPEIYLANNNEKLKIEDHWLDLQRIITLNNDCINFINSIDGIHLTYEDMLDNNIPKEFVDYFGHELNGISQYCGKQIERPYLELFDKPDIIERMINE